MVAISASVGRRSTGIGSMARVCGGGLRDLLDAEQRNVDGAARNVAAQRFQQARQQRRGQLRPIGLQRIQHRDGGAARVIGG